MTSYHFLKMAAVSYVGFVCGNGRPLSQIPQCVIVGFSLEL